MNYLNHSHQGRDLIKPRLLKGVLFKPRPLKGVFNNSTLANWVLVIITHPKWYITMFHWVNKWPNKKKRFSIWFTFLSPYQFSGKLTSDKWTKFVGNIECYLNTWTCLRITFFSIQFVLSFLFSRYGSRKKYYCIFSLQWPLTKRFVW